MTSLLPARRRPTTRGNELTEAALFDTLIVHFALQGQFVNGLTLGSNKG
ncbi:hypothetical protein [Streptomyces roseochromogenus]|uniref:Uncharacterized protein n=1 Tax=Streptomyces roseochromogenus subsp. oscitans DS 12.976 TaxID=1352936 RepID=V6KTR8_STRRC|nr:hypothetical protein [Streptomyces roseochromogenus]EST35413.1 hypothetical protein M878_06220 [Streptomyces roseochromogenus subsp. oscitans DS 12.976]